MNEQKAIMNEVDEILKLLGEQRNLQAHTGVPADRNAGFQHNTGFRRGDRLYRIERFQHVKGQDNAGFFESKGFRGSPTCDSTNGSTRSTLNPSIAGNQGGAEQLTENEYNRNARSQKNRRPYWGFENYGRRKCRDWVWRANGNDQGVGVYGGNGGNSGDMDHRATHDTHNFPHEPVPYHGNAQYQGAVPY